MLLTINLTAAYIADVKKKAPRVRIALELPRELRTQLESEAERQDRSLSAAIRQLLVRALETQKEKIA
jgi:hypothetical protein